MSMQWLIMLLVASSIFAAGVLAGIRGQETNLRQRERRLTHQRRELNDQLQALDAYHQVNTLIYHAQHQLRQAALLDAHGMPVPIDHTLQVPTSTIGPHP